MILLFLVSFICLTNTHDAITNDENEMTFDNIEDYIDPNDMLAFSNAMKNEIKEDLQDKQLNLEDGCSLHKGKIRTLSKQVEECGSKLACARASLHQAKDTIMILQDNHTINATPDISTFYSRLVMSFWHLLEMEKQEKLLSDEEKRIEVLQVSFSLQDIKLFRSLFNETTKHSAIDEFFYSNFEKISTTKDDSFKAYLEREWLQPFANLEIWLYGLGLLVLILSCWAFSLCIIDIQKNMRWTRVVAMIFFLLFVISCVEHWRVMVKNAEVRKRTEMSQVAPEDCHLQPSYLEVIRIGIFGGDSKCEKYHRQVLVDSSEEVTPLMAISETISLFFLQPFKHMGTHAGLFFREFYGTVPLLWAIPATSVLCFLVIAILFASFGYGIEFPFWLGGIRPISRSGTGEKQLNQLLEENRKHLRDERNTLLNEAKYMLRDISIAAIGHTQRIQNEAVMLQPFFASSADIIEKQLEKLVSKRFNCQLERSADKMRPTDAVDYGGGNVSKAIVSARHDDYSQDDFVTQIKHILEDSFPSDGSYNSPRSPTNCSDRDEQNGFLAEVRQVMTP